MIHEPGLKEDAKNLSLVTGSGILAALLTMGLFAASQMTAEPQPEQIIYQIEPVVEIVTVEEPEPIVVDVRMATSSADRLYGTVTTVYGSEFTGFLRWDRNEGSAVDLLDATKPRRRGGSSVSGIRFGHVDRLDVLSRDAALFTLKSGDQVELTANASDLGSGLRALLVDEGDGRLAEFEWRDIESVDFGDPGDRRPAEDRLFGTLTTRSGLEFTGYITWDVDEIYSTDILDGELDGRRVELRFGDIARIERESTWGSRVTLHSGEEMILEGTNDVDASIRNISVSDPTLGQVLLEWDEFDNVRFHGSDDMAPSVTFDGGPRIHGTVVTELGEELTGDILWDSDEAYTWEMLNGELRGVEFNVEFGMIDRIVKTRNGSAVTLRDGRTFELGNVNDVDNGNRGITISTDGRTYQVDWRDFAELRLSR